MCHEAWNAFRRAFQSNAASGFMIDWKLQADLISLGVSGEVVFEKSEVLQTVSGSPIPKLVSGHLTCPSDNVASGDGKGTLGCQ